MSKADGIDSDHVLAACEAILGVGTVEALVSGRIPLPRIMSLAAEKAFVRDHKGVLVEVLRDAMRRFEAGEYLKP